MTYTIDVATTSLRPTHHVKLTDEAANTLALIAAYAGKENISGIKQAPFPTSALKMNQGAAGYDDNMPPYTSISQTNFAGGRGLEDFEKDAARFSDSYRANTYRGDVICGGKATLTTGYKTSVYTTSANNAELAGTTEHDMFASRFTTVGGFTARLITFWALPVTATNGIYTVSGRVMICENSVGAPSTIIASSYFSVNRTDAALFELSVSVSCSLSASTDYWAVIYLPVPASSSTWSVATNTAAAGNKIIAYQYPSTLVDTTNNQAVRFTVSSMGPGANKYFEYKGQLYTITKPDDQSVPRLWMNGYRGVAIANTGVLNILKTAVVLPVDTTLIGKTIQIVGGTGIEENIPYRKIAKVDLVSGNYEVSISPNWNITHDNTTEWVIKEDNTWQEITAATDAGAASSATNIHKMADYLTKPVTSVLVVDDVIHVAQGQGQKIMHLQLQTSGVWRDASQDNAYADLLTLSVNEKGERQVWRTSAVASKASYSSVPAAWNDPFGFTDVVCRDTSTRITGIQPYGYPEMPWVFKEDGFGAINNKIYAREPLGAMKSLRSLRNGKASLHHDKFLYFSFLDGLERFYDGNLDDVGPNRDEGLPANRQGPIVRLYGYAGRFFACVDAGDAGYSSILESTGNKDWHEVYRAPLGQRIRDMYIQPIDGSMSRMWVSQEEDIYWLPIAIDPLHTTGYTYFSGAQVETAWYYASKYDQTKHWHSISVFSENLDTTHHYITVEYKTDNDTSWSSAGNITTSPQQELALSASDTVDGKRIKFRFTLVTDDELVTPRIKAIVINCVTRDPVKRSWQIPFIVKEANGYILDLNENPTDTTIATFVSRLASWASATTTPNPLTMRSHAAEFDNVKVFIEPASLMPLRYENMNDDSAIKTYSGSLTLLED